MNVLLSQTKKIYILFYHELKELSKVKPRKNTKKRGQKLCASESFRIVK